MKLDSRLLLIVIWFFTACPSSAAPVSDFLVHYSDTKDAASANMRATQRAATLSSATGLSLSAVGSRADGSHVMRSSAAMTPAQAWDKASAIRLQPGVNSVSPIDPDFGKRPPVRPVGAVR